MVDVDAITGALSLLEQERARLVDEVTRVDAAIHALRDLAQTSTASYDPHRPSVRTKLMSLLDEERRDWSAGEILDAYQRRGDPIHGADPSNALRAAIADAHKKGMIVRTDVGRYRSVKWGDTVTLEDGSPQETGSVPVDREAIERRLAREVSP